MHNSVTLVDVTGPRVVDDVAMVVVVADAVLVAVGAAVVEDVVAVVVVVVVVASAVGQLILYAHTNTEDIRTLSTDVQSQMHALYKYRLIAGAKRPRRSGRPRVNIAPFARRTRGHVAANRRRAAEAQRKRCRTDARIPTVSAALVAPVGRRRRSAAADRRTCGLRARRRIRADRRVVHAHAARWARTDRVGRGAGGARKARPKCGLVEAGHAGRGAALLADGEQRWRPNDDDDDGGELQMSQHDEADRGHCAHY